MSKLQSSLLKEQDGKENQDKYGNDSFDIQKNDKIMRELREVHIKRKKTCTYNIH